MPTNKMIKLSALSGRTPNARFDRQVGDSSSYFNLQLISHRRTTVGVTGAKYSRPSLCDTLALDYLLHVYIGTAN